MSFVQLITRVVISQTNGRRQAFFSKKGVDAKRSYTHNAPRNADEGSAKKRSEEHTSELQSQSNPVCRLLLEKKKKLLAETNATLYAYIPSGTSVTRLYASLDLESGPPA